MFWLEMSQPPRTRSLGSTMGRMFLNGMNTELPERSVPSRIVDA
jgi:hypothetical protein